MKKFFPHSFEKAVTFCEMLNECYNQYYCRKRSVAWNWSMTVRSSCQEVFYKKGVLENFAKLTGKHLRRVSFLKKLQAWGLQLYLRRDPSTGVFVWTLQNFSVQLFSGNNSGGSMWTVFVQVHSISIFFIGIHSMQVWTATARQGFSRKRSTKRLKHTEICLEGTCS